jgi:hypothetical protein
VDGVITVQTLYSFRDTYGLPDLKMSTLRRFRDLLVSNTTAGEAFMRYYFSGYDAPLFENVCSLDATIENYWQCRLLH